MKATLNFEVSVRLCGFACDANKTHLEVVCVFGKATAAPNSESEIPLTIKEMLIDGRPLDYLERMLMLKLIGGEQALMTQLKAM